MFLVAGLAPTAADEILGIDGDGVISIIDTVACSVTLLPELCTDSLCECSCVRSGLTAVVRWELGNWSFGFSVPGFPSRPESASAKPRSEVACFQYVAASA